MGQGAITYQELKLSLCDILYIEELKIEEEVNEHTRISLTALLTGDKKDDMIYELEESVCLFSIKEGKAIPLFQGRITKASLNKQGEFYQLLIEAASFTYDMDITRKSRSFQDISMMSNEVIEKIMESYQKKDNISFIENKPIEELVVQYEETDWEFLKRFISKYKQGIYVENSFDGIRFFSGISNIEKNIEWDKLPYCMYKDVEEYQKVKQNGLSEQKDSDYATFSVKSYEYISLGTNLVFHHQPVAVFKIYRKLENGELISEYHLRRKDGLKQKRLYNKRITGISIDGRVLEVKRDKIKIKLNIDKEQDKEKAYWFPYSTVSASKGGSGWYCMPKIGEQVRAYFPVQDESQSYAITKIEAHTPDVPEEGDTMGNPDVKNISTPQNKEIYFTENGVEIKTDGGVGQVFLNLDGTVTISGMENISFAAIEDITFRAEQELSISADKSIDLFCEKDGHIEIKPGGKMSFEAKEIYEN